MSDGDKRGWVLSLVVLATIVVGGVMGGVVAALIDGWRP